MPTGNVSLVLANGNILTMEPSQPCVEAVAIVGERVAAVGGNEFIRSLASTNTEIIDCQGLTLLPGLNDAHCHLQGLARRLRDLDCSPQRAVSIAEIQILVCERAATRAPGSWIRGHGYDDLQLAEHRHPNRHDLDMAAPDHPVWLEQRSGHAAILNSRALGLAGITRETPDPPGGVIERELATGEPTGTLYEMRSHLRQSLGSVRSTSEFEDGMRAADELLRSYGITSIQDAGADNDVARWTSFHNLQASGVLATRITMFAGIGKLNEFAGACLTFGSGTERLRLGHAKIVLTLTTGALQPTYPELDAAIVDAHNRGFPVAIHCIEEEAIAAAASALQARQHSGLIDRIEHCAEGTPALIAAVRRSGATVITQPGFLYHNGESYRNNVEPRLLPHLYPAGALLRSGVPTAFGSDAPVIDPNPWPAIYSAVTRRTSEGLLLSSDGLGEQTVSVNDAFRMYTVEAAMAEGTSKVKGSIAPGKLADMVLVDADPAAVDREALPKIKAVLTISSGAVVWDNR